MKKFSSFLLCLLLLFTLVSCAKEPTPSQLVFLGATEDENLSPFSLTSFSFESASVSSRLFATRQKTLSLSGETYTLSYCNTLSSRLLPHSVDRYESSEDSAVVVEAYFFGDTGELFSVSLKAAEAPASSQGAPVTEEDFRTLAEKLLADYTDISGWAYSCSTSQIRQTNSGIASDRIDGFCPDAAEECDSFENIYHLRFSRTVAGFSTNEAAEVALRQDGQLCSFSLPRIPDAANPETICFTAEEVCALATETARAAHKSEQTLASLAATDVQLLWLSDGTPCFQVSLFYEHEDCTDDLCTCPETLTLCFAAAPGGDLPASLKSD